MAHKRFLRAMMVGSMISASFLMVLSPGVAAANAATSVTPSAQGTPTLEVHVTANGSLDGYPNPSPTGPDAGLTGPDQILPHGALPAGPGFIYEITQLDYSAVITVKNSIAVANPSYSAAQVSEHTQTEILANPKKYFLAGGSVLDGDSNATGDIDTGVCDSHNEGCWLSGATDTNHMLVGGSAYTTFPGTEVAPSMWYLKLVDHPANIKVLAAADGIITLPFTAPGDEAAHIPPGPVNMDVNVSPKLVGCMLLASAQSQVAPQNSSAAATATAATAMPTTTPMPTPASTDGLVPFPPCETTVTPPPSPSAPAPTHPTKPQPPQNPAYTGFGAAAIAGLALLAMVLGLAFLAAKRRRRDNS